MLDVGLGDKIREAREQAGLTQDDLAYRLRVYPTLERVTSSLISGWENDEVKRVSFYAVAGIAQETGKPLEFFSEQHDAQTGAGGSVLRRRALPASADLDAAKAPHESDPLTRPDRSTRRRRGKQADAEGT